MCVCLYLLWLYTWDKNFVHNFVYTNLHLFLLLFCRYAAYLVSNFESDLSSDSPFIVNKRLFRQYMQYFPEGQEAIRTKTNPAKKDTSQIATTPLSSLFLGRKLSQHCLQRKIKLLCSPTKPQPSMPYLLCWVIITKKLRII